MEEFVGILTASVPSSKAFDPILRQLHSTSGCQTLEEFVGILASVVFLKLAEPNLKPSHPILKVYHAIVKQPHPILNLCDPSLKPFHPILKASADSVPILTRFSAAL